MKPGTLSTVLIRWSISSTLWLAPPWSGPNSAPMPAAVAEYGSTCDDPTLRTADVEQFCSWSACRISRTSSALAIRGSAWYFSSAILNSMPRKFSA